MAKLIASHVTDSRASVRASGGSFERVTRLDGGDGELALAAGTCSQPLTPATQA